MQDVRSQLQSSLGAAYTLQRELGGGGMSRVFVANETRLGRKVVVKVLSSETGAELSADRFEREIRIAATLQHPNIVPVLSAGAMDGLPYYTMPFVDGLSLRQRITRDGPLPIHDAVTVLRDVARALSYAHERSVVHRDIKPENVLLSSGAALVTDFGIAKALAASKTGPVQVTLTQPGTSLGTPAYMAPEQAIADSTADHRVDLYALGCVAYELLTGTPPFSGTSVHQLVAAHLTEEPTAVTLRRSEVPESLSTLVMRCLAKDPAQRPDTAGKVVRQLEHVLADMANAGTVTLSAKRQPVLSNRSRWIAAVGAVVMVGVVIGAIRTRGHLASGTAGTPRSLAVLAFENASHDTASDYLVEGLGDELRSRLTGVPGLAVKGRASSALFVGRSDPVAVGTKLGVTTILTGLVRRSATALQVNAELDDTRSGDALWSRNFEGDVNAFPNIRDSLVEQVTRALRLAGSAPDTSRALDRGTSNFEAYDKFLRGQHSFARLDFAGAASDYAQAVRLDPSFARGWASLTIALASMPRGGLTPSDSALAAARVSLAHATTLDSTAPLVRVAQATVLGVSFQFQRAAAILGDVIADDPQNVFANEQYVWMLGNLGRLDEALAAIDRVRRVDPLSPFVTVARQYTLEVLRRYPESIDVGRQGLRDNPTDPIVLRNLSADYAFTGQPDSAVALMERARLVDSLGFGWLDNLALAYATAGRWSDVDRLETESRRHPRGNSPAYTAATFAIINGRYDAAIADIQRGIADAQPMFNTAWLSCEPTFDPLRRDARFAAVVHSLGARTCAAAATWPIPVRKH